jgi:hypothetical protein
MKGKQVGPVHARLKHTMNMDQDQKQNVRDANRLFIPVPGIFIFLQVCFSP